jgi:hypothetical protein
LQCVGQPSGRAHIASFAPTMVGALALDRQ